MVLIRELRCLGSTLICETDNIYSIPLLRPLPDRFLVAAYDIIGVQAIVYLPAFLPPSLLLFPCPITLLFHSYKKTFERGYSHLPLFLVGCCLWQALLPWRLALTF